MISTIDEGDIDDRLLQEFMEDDATLADAIELWVGLTNPKETLSEMETRGEL